VARRRRSCVQPPAQDGLDVHDRGSVDGLEVAHAHAGALDRHDLHRVQPDRVGAIGRARVEDALHRVGRIVARAHAQDVAPRTVEPREHDELGARRDAVEAVEHGRLEDEPGVGRPLQTLLGRRRRVGQLGLDPPDRRELDHRASRTGS
jgi:hypothetical protein